ncbi:conserved hypothetical protein [Bathymodiolus platifrons methanotrophic gill symbiont]|nr:conserved hypothetical protein [Bathymodiolus platifrons methanotrophic gill symbiont]GFO75698.1 hypothetical protein BPLS_P3060 [Bathymodiolus platifrons methanotrophic gill symbiont]
MVFGTSACSLFTQTEPEMSASEVCVKLNELVADHANDFKQFRGVRKNTRRIINMQIWNAERVFPQARNCQVWAWSSGLTNYICTWQESGELEAKASHDKGVETVKQCLTEQWKSDFVQTSSGGGHTFFQQEGSKTVVSIRYFKESRTILDNWKAILYVGDKNNLNAEVN